MLFSVPKKCDSKQQMEVISVTFHEVTNTELTEGLLPSDFNMTGVID